MQILLVAGGNPREWPKVRPEEMDFFVGVDRGSLFLLEQGWPLDLAVGDFDSSSTEERARIKESARIVQTAQAEKDDTDTQLALQTVLQQFPEAQVTIIGATGGRLDHFLANLWLPLEPRFQPFIRQLCIADNQNHITFYLPGKYTVTQVPDMDYLAYICLTPVQNLTLTRSKYTLTATDVLVPTSYASNEFIENTADFSFDTGVLAVIQSRDK